MHYIRFLKPPRVLPALQPLNLTTKITVTTDLGESFLLANMSLLVELEYEDGTSVLGSGKGREYMWRGEDGMRSLEIVVPFPPTNGKRKIGGQMVRMFIRPKEAEYDVNTFEMVLNDQDTNVDSGESGVVVAVRSMAVDISSSTEGGKAPSVGMAERVFAMDSNDSKRKVRIWEETGESIARHIWDAGLVLSSYLSTLTSVTSSTRTVPQLPVLEKVLQRKDFNVLELGAGCGIVGISLATSYPRISKVLLTDLAEASEIIEKNLSPSMLPPPTLSRLAHQVLDWAFPLPLNVKGTKWDLVVVADCTYNPDVVPDLVQTLRHLSEGNEDTVVLLAMKVRHESEMVFFDLMDESGFEVREKCKIPLPVLGGEGEEIEIFVFGYGKETAHSILN